MFGQAYTGGFESVQEPVDGFWGPRDVVVSPDGLIYVADTGNKRVRAYRIVDGIAEFDKPRVGSLCSTVLCLLAVHILNHEERSGADKRHSAPVGCSCESSVAVTTPPPATT